MYCANLTNVYTRLTKKHISGWVTFKCHNSLWSIFLAIKESLRIENGTQCTNHQMNNAIKNQIC